VGLPRRKIAGAAALFLILDSDEVDLSAAKVSKGRPQSPLVVPAGTKHLI